MPSSRAAPGSPALPVLLLLFAMASIQAGASMAKSLFQAVGASGAVTLRTAFATVLLFLILRPWRVRLRGTPWRSLLGYGASLGLMNLCYYLALRTLPLGITVTLEFTGPLAVALLASRRRSDFLWVVLVVLGLLLLLPLPAGGAALDPGGVLLALAAGACWALYIVFGQRAGEAYGTASVGLGSLVSAAIVVPVGVANAGAALLSPAVVPVGLAVAVLSTALPYTIEMFALTRLPTRSFGILMSLEPAFGALFGRLVLHERLSALQWLAIALIMAASIGSTASIGGERAGPVPMPE